MARRAGPTTTGKAKIEAASRRALSVPEIRYDPETDVAQKNSAVTTTVEDERENMPPPEAWWVPAKGSSRVATAAYDRQNRRVYMLFNKPYPGGTPWTYENVPPNVWRDLRRSASPGKFVNRRLNGFNYHRGTWLD